MLPASKAAEAVFAVGENTIKCRLEGEAKCTDLIQVTYVWQLQIGMRKCLFKTLLTCSPLRAFSKKTRQECYRVKLHVFACSFLRQSFIDWLWEGWELGTTDGRVPLLRLQHTASQQRLMTIDKALPNIPCSLPSAHPQKPVWGAAGSLPLLESGPSSASRTSSHVVGFWRSERTRMAESTLGAWQPMQMIATGSLSTTWDPLEMRA